MEYFLIEGGKPLCGSIQVQGAKNAALPIFAATVLAEGIHVIHDVPDLTDIRTMCQILEALGAKIQSVGTTYHIDTTQVNIATIPIDLMSRMRSSIFLMGSLLGRLGEVNVTRPGGCAIGSRPIDIHLYGLQKLGVEITETEEEIKCSCSQLNGSEVVLSFPSVGATENIMMASVLAEGKTTIVNAAREPEIVDLATFLNKMGAKVTGAGTSTVIIEGVKELIPAIHTVIPDRIVIGTFIAATGITAGEIDIHSVIPEHLSSVFHIMELCGIEFNFDGSVLKVKGPKKLNPIDSICTEPYPGFPTDMQPQLISLLSLAEGRSKIVEGIFESRLRHIDELNHMGAHIYKKENTVTIEGVPHLNSALIHATDLRAGAGLVIAALGAKGLTKVTGIEHIDRGYDAIEKVITQLGGTIVRQQTEDLLYVSNRKE